MQENKKLDFGKLTARKKKNAAPAIKKVYKEVEVQEVPKVVPTSTITKIPASTKLTELEEANMAAAEASVSTIAQEATVAPVQRKPKAKSVKKKPGKVGRRSWKKEDVDYTRLAFDTPIETKQKLKQLLATTFFNKFISQDEMINHALNDFIKKHGLKM